VVTFSLQPASFMAWDDNGKPLLEPGAFRIVVGGGQPDDRSAGKVVGTLTVV
jgi:hypothetical protein